MASTVEQPAESLLLPAGALYAIGAYNAIGFAPFSIEGETMRNADNAPKLKLLSDTYRALSGMMNLITDRYHSDNMKGIYLFPGRKEQSSTVGDYQITATSSATPGFSLDFGKSLEQVGKKSVSFSELSGNDSPPTSTTAPASTPPVPFGSTLKGIGSVLLIQNAADELVIVGYGVKFNCALKQGIPFTHLGFRSIDEGYFTNNQFVATKRWNGDEQKASLPDDKLTVLKIRFYHF